MEIDGGLFACTNFLSRLRGFLVFDDRGRTASAVGCILLPLRGCSFRWQPLPACCAELQQQGGATSGDGVLFNGQQNRWGMFDGAAKAEPGGQRNATRCLGRYVAEIENDQAEAATFEKQIRGTQHLFQAVPKLARSGAVEVESNLGGS